MLVSYSCLTFLIPLPQPKPGGRVQLRATTRAKRLYVRSPATAAFCSTFQAAPASPPSSRLFGETPGQFLARHPQNYRVGDCDGRKAVRASGEGCRQAQHRPRRKYSIQSGQALDPKTHFSPAHQKYAEVFIAGVEQDISGWDLLRLTERFQGTLQVRRRIQDVRTVTPVSTAFLCQSAGPRRGD